MRTLEVIRLRMANGKGEDLVRTVFTFAESWPGPLDLMVYRHAGFDTDILIQIRRDDLPGEAIRSPLGRSLAALLRDHGMVEHSMWIGAARSEER